MSLRSAIPQRVALLHCSPPLRHPGPSWNLTTCSSTKYQRTATVPLPICLTLGVHCTHTQSFGRWFPGDPRHECLVVDPALALSIFLILSKPTCRSSLSCRSSGAAGPPVPFAEFFGVFLTITYHECPHRQLKRGAGFFTPAQN